MDFEELIPKLSGKKEARIVPYEQRIAAFDEQVQVATVEQLQEWASEKYSDQAHAAKAELIKRGKEKGYNWISGFSETR